MLKKILAGSTAGILALTAMASAAMADDATANAKSDYILELVPGTYSTPNTVYTSAHIKATVKTSEIANLIGASMAVDVNGAVTRTTPGAGTVDTTIPSIKNFSESSYDLGTAGKPVVGKYYYLDGDGTLTVTKLVAGGTVGISNGITEGYKLIKVKSLPDADNDGTTEEVANSIQGCTYEVVQNFVGFGEVEDSANPYNKLAMGLSVLKVGDEKPYDWEDLSMTNIKLTGTLKAVGNDTVTVSNGTEEKSDVERTATATISIPDVKGGVATSKASNLAYPSSGASANFATTQPAQMSMSFGISPSKTLTRFNTNDSEFVVEFDIKMTNDHWKKLLGSAGVVWNDPATTNTWSAIDFEKLLNGNDQVIKQFLGIEGTSLVTWARQGSGATEGDLQVGSFGKYAFNEIVASDVNTDDQTYTDHQNWFYSGVTQDWSVASSDPSYGVIYSSAVPVYVTLGTAKNDVLKNLNNGGKVTFTFDKEIRSQDIFNPYIIWRGASGLVNIPLYLSNQVISADGKSLTLDFPKGLTWSEGNTNFYNGFRMDFNFNYENAYAIQDGSQGLPVVETGGGTVKNLASRNSFFLGGKDANGADNYNAKLIKITFDATNGTNAGTATTPGASDGLQSGDNNSTSTPSSNSGNTGDNANPGTGVAVAVAPVVLAAAAAAVVISKKRK